MFTDMKRCASREKDLIIEAQKKQIDSLHSESHELRRQRDQLLQRLQRAETKKPAAGRFNVDIKKSRSLSSNSPANCGNGPKVSLSDFCLAEKVKVSHAAARMVGRSALLASSCEVGGGGSSASVHREAVAAVRASSASSVRACPAAVVQRRSAGGGGASRPSGACEASRQLETHAGSGGVARRRERSGGGGGGPKRASSHSPGHATASSAVAATAVTTAAQRRLAAEIIQYQYRQHALSKSFERLKNRGSSSGSLEPAAASGRRAVEERADAKSGGWCSPAAFAETATDQSRGCGGSARAATSAAAVTAADSRHRWSPSLSSACGADEPAVPDALCRQHHQSAPAVHSFASTPVAAMAAAAVRAAAAPAKAGPFPCPDDCGGCRGIDGPSALCEKELEEADTSVFEASYMSVTAAAYSVPPSPYDNVSADNDPRCGGCSSSGQAVGSSGSCSTDCLVAAAAPSRGPDQQRWPLPPAQRCHPHEPAPAAHRSPGGGDGCGGGALLHRLSPPRHATSSPCACGCQAVAPLRETQPLLLDLVDACQEPSPPLPPARSSTGNAAPDSERQRERGASASSAKALSCRSAPPSSLHSAAVLWPGGHAAEKERKRQYRIGLNLFNKKPEHGIEYLVERRFVERTPRSVAHFLLTRKGISKQLVGEYLGNLMQPFNQEVLRSFVSQLDFKGLELDAAMRIFIVLFRLPGEAQKIERIVEVFSQRYGTCNPAFTRQFRSADTVFLLAFAIILLNTDLHNPNIKATRRMPLESFVNNLKGIDAGYDVDRELLAGIYERIQRDELKPGSDHTNQVRKVEETIVEKRCAVPKLAVPFRRLVCYCRLYEVREPLKKDRAGAHQREVFLFNDMLVVTKILSKKKSNITYSFRSSYPLIDLTATTFETEYHPYGIHLAVAADNRSLMFFNARNNHDREKFVDDLRESIQEMNEMETIRLEMASRHGKSGSSAAAMPPVMGQQQPVPTATADRCSKDSGVVVCTAGPLLSSPQLLLPPPDIDACSGGAALGATCATYHHAVSCLATVPDCGHRQQQQQCSGSDLDHDEVDKRHSSGSIDSGMISTSTGSVAETRDDEGSPHQPARVGGSGGGREGALWVSPSAAQQHVQSAGVAVPDGLSHMPHSMQN